MIAATILALFATNAQSQEEVKRMAGPLQVVTSFSVLEDWARQVGGERVAVTSLVGRDEDVHVFSASPRDLARVARADVLIVNGLRLEGWISRLVGSSGFKGRLVVASDGLPVISRRSFAPHAHGPAQHAPDTHHDGHDATPSRAQDDPHAWLSLRMAAYYIDNIEAAFSALNPQYQEEFESNARAYKQRLSELDARFTAGFNDVPVSLRKMVVPHNAFAYFARDYDISVHSLQGLDSAAEASAATFAGLVQTLRRSRINAVFGENISNNRLIERVAEEANIKLAGLLISGALSNSMARDYLSMMAHNGQLILQALNEQP